MKNFFRTFLAAGLLGIGCIFAAPANAGIQCDGGYQVIPGVGHVSTPYCQDNLVAKYARESGLPISDAEVRNNPVVKEQACSFLGGRASEACSTIEDSDG